MESSNQEILQERGSASSWSLILIKREAITSFCFWIWCLKLILFCFWNKLLLSQLLPPRIVLFLNKLIQQGKTHRLYFIFVNYQKDLVVGVGSVFARWSKNKTWLIFSEVWHVLNKRYYYLCLLLDFETKIKTESPSSDSRSQDTNEDSCGPLVRDGHREKTERPSGDGPCSPDIIKGSLLRAALSVDSEDSCNPCSASPDFSKTPSDSPGSEAQSKRTHLTQHELIGLRTLVEKLESLPENKKCVPVGIESPQALLDDMKVENPPKQNKQKRTTETITGVDIRRFVFLFGCLGCPEGTCWWWPKISNHRGSCCVMA